MKTRKKAYTLAEIVLAVMIIGLIFSIVSVSLSEIRRNSRDTRRVSDIAQIQLALEEYYRDEGFYPDTLNLGENLIGSTTNRIYIIRVPQNPQPAASNCEPSNYQYTKDGDSYQIKFCLEKNIDEYNTGQNCLSPIGEIECLP